MFRISQLPADFHSEDHIFKVLAMGAPYTKAACFGRALMIPGMVGKNMERWLKENDLPKTVSEFGEVDRRNLRLLRSGYGYSGQE